MLKHETILNGEQLLEIVTDFKALGDEGRLKIVICLLNGKKSVGEISKVTGCSQSATSHQLRVLKDAKILKCEKQGNINFYFIADSHVKTIIETSIEHLNC